MSCRLLVLAVCSLPAVLAAAPSSSPFVVLKVDRLNDQVGHFNAMENETFVGLVPNAQAADWLDAQIPLFECPDPQVEQMYDFRWWAFRKHLKKTPDGFEVFTEFINKPPISSALGHHVMEGRWLRDQDLIGSDADYWLHGQKNGPQTNLHKYSSWLAYALYQRYLANGDKAWLVAHLDDLVADYRQWEKEKLNADGSFWQFDVRDAMEESISGSRTKKNVRPTINSYMYGNAVAIAAVSRLAGRPELAAEFAAKAKGLRTLVEERLWNPDDAFFEAREEDGSFAKAREEIGFIPWYFELPEQGRGFDKAWLQLDDPTGFSAPYGITTAERRNPAFRTHGVGNCEWDGAVWPFATSQTLTALANVLRDYPGAPVTSQDFFSAFVTYVKSQHYDGIPYIGEYLDEKNGQWLKGHNERSRWYNHSTFADLVISDLAGVRPSEGTVLDLSPLLPSGLWDWFCVDGVPYHGGLLTVLWDKTGSHYGRGAGLTVWYDGKVAAHSDRFGPLRVNLATP